MNGVPGERWRIPAADRQLYETYFAQLRSQDGFVDSATARDFFTKSRLSKTFLADMWNKADHSKDGRLDRNEFCIAMHILMSATHQQGGLQVPNGSSLSRSHPTSPLHFLPTHEIHRRSSATPPPYPVGSSTKPWDFSAFAMTLPKKSPIVSGSPQPGNISWPSKNAEMLAPAVRSLTFPVRSASPRSNFSEILQSKRKDLKDLKFQLEIFRKEKLTISQESAQIVRKKATIGPLISATTSSLDQKQEFLEQTKRQAAVIQSANTLLERQLKQLNQAIQKEKENQLPEVPFTDSPNSTKILQELKLSLGDTILHEGLIRKAYTEGARTTIHFENTFTNKKKRIQNLLGILEKSREDHVTLLRQFENKQRRVHQLQPSSSLDTEEFDDSAKMAAIAAFVGAPPNELSFQEGDFLYILEKNDDAWWLARNTSGEIGHVPANYMQEAGRGSLTEEEKKENWPKQNAEYAVASYAYQARNSDELTFAAEDVIEILPLADPDPDWFFGRLVASEATGLVPANYLRFAAQETQGQKAPHSEAEDVDQDDPNRLRAIQELVQTEEKYLGDISAVMDIFHAQLKASGILPENILQKIFFVWPELIRSATYMVSVLRNPANCGFSDLDECIGAVLCEHLPNQAPYVVFCSNQVKISELIREKTAESCKFDEFLRACSQEPRLQGLPLTTAYVKPMQRITRYPLLIKRILELTADSHPDLPNLKEALLKAEDLCRKVNERVRQTENLERFEWLQTHVALEEFSEKIKFNSTTNFLGARTLLYSGTLFKVKSGRETVAFLFNDFLLFTTPPRPLAASLGNFSFDKRQWTSVWPFRLYRKPLLLSGCSVSALSEPQCFLLTFPNCLSFPLKATTATECKSWMKKVREAVVESAKKEGTKSVLSALINQPAVVGCCRLIVLEAVELKAKHDTFCRVSLGDQEKSTRVVEHSTEPKWDQHMTFNIHNLQVDVLSLTVFDFNAFAPNGFLGRAELRLVDVFTETKGLNVPLTKRVLLSGVESGEVALKIDIQMFPVTPPS